MSEQPACQASGRKPPAVHRGSAGASVPPAVRAGQVSPGCVRVCGRPLLPPAWTCGSWPMKSGAAGAACASRSLLLAAPEDGPSGRQEGLFSQSPAKPGPEECHPGSLAFGQCVAMPGLSPAPNKLGLRRGRGNEEGRAARQWPWVAVALGGRCPRTLGAGARLQGTGSSGGGLPLRTPCCACRHGWAHSCRG